MFSTVQRVALVSFFGQLYFFVPVMTPYLQREGLSLAEIASLQTILLWAQLVMEIPTGVLADRLGHRRSYQLALAMAVGAELWFVFAHSYPMFVISQVIAGTGFAFASGSVDAYVYDSLPEDRRPQRMQRARGVIGAATHVASVVAYGTTALVAANLTHDRMVLTLWMGVAGLSIALGLGLTLRDVADREIPGERASSGMLLAEGWRTLRTNRALQRVVLFALVTNTFGAHLLVFYQAYFLDTGVRGEWLGIGLSLGSLAAVLTQLHAWRLPARLGTHRGMLVAAVIPGVLYLAMAVNGNPVLAVVLFVVQWGATQLIAPLLSGLYNAEVPDRARATALSLISGIVTIYVGAMGVLLGWLAERSLGLMFGLVGVMILIGTFLVRIDDRAEV